MPRGTKPPRTFKNPNKDAGTSKTETKKEFFLACGKVFNLLKKIETNKEQSQNKAKVEAVFNCKSLILNEIVNMQ